MPDDVTLTSHDDDGAARQPVAGAGADARRHAAQGFVIAGTAFSYDSVARLLSRLALVPDLNDVTLTSTGSGASPGASAGARQRRAVQHQRGVKGAPAPPAPAVIPPAPADTTRRGERMRGKKISRRGAVALIVGRRPAAARPRLVPARRAAALDGAEHRPLRAGDRGAGAAGERAAIDASRPGHPAEAAGDPDRLPLQVVEGDADDDRHAELAPRAEPGRRAVGRPAHLDLAVADRPRPAPRSITLSVTGDFYSLTDLLYRLRSSSRPQRRARRLGPALLDPVGRTDADRHRSAAHGEHFAERLHVRRAARRGHPAAAPSPTDTSTTDERPPRRRARLRDSAVQP